MFDQTLVFKELRDFIEGNQCNSWSFIFDNPFLGVIVCDDKGIVLKMNKTHFQITGLTPDNLTGHHTEDFVNQGLMNKSVTSMVLQTHKPQLFEQISNNKEFLVKGEPIFEGSVLRYVVCLIMDVSLEILLKNELADYKLKKDLAESKLCEMQAMLDNMRAGFKDKNNPEIIYISSKMKSIMQLVEKISDSYEPVLITGESGVGKELIAKTIHQSSPRKTAPFISINCAAIPEGLLESELFGYEGGTFTNSNTQGKQGLFEAADHGTIFLDEIGDMPIQLQVKILRVLQEKTIRKVGSVKDKRIDVRIISATNNNLKELINQKKFREDLFYRLNVININIPPLRDHKEDIPLLAYYFLNKLNMKYNRHKSMTLEALHFLMELEYKGNVRELENIISRMYLVSQNDEISTKDILIASLENDDSDTDVISDFKFLSLQKTFQEMSEEFEKQLFKMQLEKNKSTYEIAKSLGINQSTVWRKLKKFKLI